ncbi:hypothetical protein, partial [Bacillus rhizoplanae]|uniref:hypothetical protein n=1 Tax=Bacillus rhizoplanae TaxID=2880966 RepID=UPI003D19ACB5
MADKPIKEGKNQPLLYTHRLDLYKLQRHVQRSVIVKQTEQTAEIQENEIDHVENSEQTHHIVEEVSVADPQNVQTDEPEIDVVDLQHMQTDEPEIDVVDPQHMQTDEPEIDVVDPQHMQTDEPEIDVVDPQHVQTDEPEIDV